MKQTLKYSRANRDADETGAYGPFSGDIRYANDLWRVPWQALGFDYCGVYLITPRAGWPVKIGISECVPKRLAGLQTAHWNELVCASYWLVENRKLARRVEAYAHDVASKEGAHLLGEWFDMRPTKAAGVVEYGAALLGVEVAKQIPDTPKFEAVHRYIADLRDAMYHQMSVNEAAAHLNGDVRNADLPRVIKGWRKRKAPARA